jgi:hypothetical protein
LFTHLEVAIGGVVPETRIERKRVQQLMARPPALLIGGGF